jgi:DNA polymerase III epsilon subunit-like protein
MKIIIFDTETTGLPKSRQSLVTDTHDWPHIVQFSYIIYDMTTNKLDKVFDSIICLDESIEIPEESSNIHGITKELSLEKGNPIKIVIDEFMEDIKQCNMLIAHNMEFDMNMVIVELLRLNKQNEDFIELNSINYEQLMKIEKYCTMKEMEKKCNIKAISKNGREYTKFPTLAELHYHLFKNYPKNLHNSLNDILICFRCYFWIITKKDIYITNNQIAELLGPLII